MLLCTSCSFDYDDPESSDDQVTIISPTQFSAEVEKSATERCHEDAIDQPPQFTGPKIGGAKHFFNLSSSANQSLSVGQSVQCRVGSTHATAVIVACSVRKSEHISSTAVRLYKLASSDGMIDPNAWYEEDMLQLAPRNSLV